MFPTVIDSSLICQCVNDALILRTDLNRPRPGEPDEALERGAQHEEVGTEGAGPEVGQQREHRQSRDNRSFQQTQERTGDLFSICVLRYLIEVKEALLFKRGHYLFMTK